MIVLNGGGTEYTGRTPHGVRGLKWKVLHGDIRQNVSHPARGAWIEIAEVRRPRLWPGPSHPARGAWIEIVVRLYNTTTFRSHPARGAWIEMPVSPQGR